MSASVARVTVRTKEDDPSAIAISQLEVLARKRWQRLGGLTVPFAEYNIGAQPKSASSPLGSSRKGRRRVSRTWREEADHWAFGG